MVFFYDCNPALPSGNSFTINGFKNGSQYTILLRAVNINGQSLLSDPTTVIPSTIPDAPNNLSGLNVYTSSFISFIPSYDGGNTVSKYEFSITPGIPGYTGGIFHSCNPLIPLSNTFQLTGLTYNVTYSVVLRGVNINGPSANSNTFTIIPLSPVCFPDKTPITCDQGVIDIEKINPGLHTIQGKAILAVTKSIYELNTLVCIEKDALYKNVPSKNTLMTFHHKVFYNGEMREAQELIDLNDKIYVKKTKSKFIYNVLMEKYDKMVVNNLIVDTLHPESKIAKYYARNGYKLNQDYEENMLEMSRQLYKINKNNKI